VIRDISFAGSTVRVEYEGDDATWLADFLFARMPRDSSGHAPHATLSLTRDEREGDEPTFSLAHDGRINFSRLSGGAAGRHLLERLLFHLADRSRDGLALHAAALSRGTGCVLFPGTTGSGKTTLSAWLATQGYTYLTDELVFVPAGSNEVVPFVRPLNVRKRAVSVLGLTDEPHHSARLLSGPDITLYWPDVEHRVPEVPVSISRIVFPKYDATATFEATRLSKAEAGLGLMSCLINARNLEGHGFSEVARLVKTAPCFEVRYPDFSRLGAWLDESVVP